MIKNIIKAQQSNIGEKLKNLAPAGSSLDESIQSISDALTSIHQTLLEQQDVADDQADDDAVETRSETRSETTEETTVEPRALPVATLAKPTPTKALPKKPTKGKTLFGREIKPSKY